MLSEDVVVLLEAVVVLSEAVVVLLIVVMMISSLYCRIKFYTIVLLLRKLAMFYFF